MADCENRTVIKLADLHTGLEPVESTVEAGDTTECLALLTEIKEIVLELNADIIENPINAHAIQQIASTLRYLAGQFDR
jgi:uncharacterized protein YqgV (UPF0045/DUF77 family)